MIAPSNPNPNAYLRELINKDSINVSLINSTIMRGADVNSIDRLKMTGSHNASEIGEYPLLARAILRQNYTATKLLLDNGAKVERYLKIGPEEKDSISMHDFALRLHDQYDNDNSRRILWAVTTAAKAQSVS